MPPMQEQVRTLWFFLPPGAQKGTHCGLETQILIANMPDVRPLASILRSLSFRAVRCHHPTL